MQWYRINKDYRPVFGYAIYVTENPEEGGTAYHVDEVNEHGFSMVSKYDENIKEFVRYDTIDERTDLYAWDRFREQDFPDYNPNKIVE